MSADYGYDKYYSQQRADAVQRLRAGVDSISDDQVYAATLALDQMKWKINNLRLTQAEYAEWRSFIDAFSRLLPEIRK